MTKTEFAKPFRYHSLAILLHWGIAIGLLFMLCSGWYMVNADISKADQFRLYQVHKAAGVLVFISILLRLFVRLVTRQPDLPISIAQKERQFAKYGHLALYVVMLLMPMSGWLMVSSSPFGLPTIVFDLFEWPHIPGLARNKELETLAKYVHWYVGIGFIGLIALHVGAVVKHKRQEKLNLLNRMWWSKAHEQ